VRDSDISPTQPIATKLPARSTGSKHPVRNSLVDGSWHQAIVQTSHPDGSPHDLCHVENPTKAPGQFFVCLDSTRVEAVSARRNRSRAAAQLLDETSVKVLASESKSHVHKLKSKRKSRAESIDFREVPHCRVITDRPIATGAIFETCRMRVGVDVDADKPEAIIRCGFRKETRSYWLPGPPWSSGQHGSSMSRWAGLRSTGAVTTRELRAHLRYIEAASPPHPLQGAWGGKPQKPLSQPQCTMCSSDLRARHS
jgi:hypothetical protein